MPNDTTPRGLPLPHPDNIAREDAARIREAITEIDTALTSLDAKETPAATETVSGRVRLATAAEATSGTATDAVPNVKRTKDMISAALTATQAALTQLQAAVTANMAANDNEVDQAIINLNASIATQIAAYNVTLNGKAAKSANLTDLADKDAARNALNAQIAGNYQAALGYAPVNRAGDTITGGLTVNGTINSANWVISPRAQRYADVADLGGYATTGAMNNFVVHCRFVHAGDAVSVWTQTGYEIGSACLTSAGTVYNDDSVALWLRFRYLQYYIPNIGYASFVWN